MQDDPIKLLLVEAEPLSCETALEMLGQSTTARFEVTQVRRLGEALNLLEAGRFDVILVDLSLPDQKGLATFREVHAMAPSLPIVVLTGSADESLAFQAVREGAQDYLMNGEFDAKLLSRVLRYAIERKRAEQALRQREEFFRLITENVSDLIAVLDKDGNRLYNSPSYQKSLSNAGSLQGTNSFKEIHPEDKEKVRAIFRETIKTGEGQRAEYRMLLTDGSVRHIESQGSAVRDETGEPAKVIVVSRDITERKQQMEALETALAQLKTAHEDLKTAQMRLIESEKLEAVSTFAGGIAHEVKNPLQTITLGIDFLSSCIGESDPNAVMVLNDMSSASRRADGVIRGLVEFSSYNKRDVRAHDLSDIVEQALRSVESEVASRSIQLVKELAVDLPCVQLDLKTMKHVLLNFLMSAIESMPQGGILSLKTYSLCLLENQGWSGRTPGQLKAGDTIVGAEVEDNGTGVIESRLADSSDRDFPTELIRKGILDLMVLKKVIELYGGMIQIVNRKEGGVRVTIMFKVT